MRSGVNRLCSTDLAAKRAEPAGQGSLLGFPGWKAGAGGLLEWWCTGARTRDRSYHPAGFRCGEHESCLVPRRQAPRLALARGYLSGAATEPEKTSSRRRPTLFPFPRAGRRRDATFSMRWPIRLTLFALPMAGELLRLVLAHSPANEDRGQFSPNGRWVAPTGTVPDYQRQIPGNINWPPEEQK
jgi:hypothetical protein